MANTTPQYIRGFILPMNVGMDNIWEAQSTFTQQGAAAGDPIPQQSSKMRLLATGGQSSSGDITIKSRSAGVAGYGSRFTFTDNTYSTTDEFGRDSFNAISGFDFIKRSGAVGLVDQYYNPTAIVTKEDTLLIAYQKTTTSSTDVAMVTRITRDGTSSDISIHTSIGSATTQNLHSVITEMMDGSLVYAHILESDGTANLRVYRSTDDGSTWSTISREAFADTIAVGTTSGVGTQTYDIQRLRMESHNGTILLLVETEYNNTSATKRNVLFQYVSIDGGGTFSKITTDDNAESNSFRNIQLMIRDGRFVVAYTSGTGAAQYINLPTAYSNIHLLRQANAYSALIALGGLTGGTNDYMTGGDSAVWTDDDGSIYAVFYSSTRNDYVSRYSADGVFWKYTNGNFNVDRARFINFDDTTTRPTVPFGLKWLGRNILLSNCSVTSNLDNSILIHYLGGYSNINLPKSNYTDPIVDWSRVGWTNNYLPIDLPSDISGLTASGAGNDTLSGGFLSIESSATYPAERYYSFNALDTTGTASEYISQGVIIRASFKAVSGGDLGSNVRGILLQIDDGTTTDYQVVLYVTPTQFKLRDFNAAADLGTVNFDSTDGIDVIIALSDNNVAMWYRSMENEELRTWTAGPSSSTLSNGGGTSAGIVIEFGHISYTLGTMETDWNEFHVSTLGATGLQMSGGFDNPEDLNTRPYPPLGQFVYVYDGVSISTTDGPTYEGDDFNITPQFRYPIDNIFFDVVPSPRIQWRSNAVTSGSVPSQEISIKMDPSLSHTNKDYMLNDLIGIHLNNINWISGEIYYYDGSWISLGSINNRIRSSCQVSGRTARGAVGFTEPYFTLNELVGWTCYFLESGSATRHYRKITANTEGIFGGTSTGTKQCVIQLDTQPPQTSIAVYFIPPIISIVMNMNGKSSTGFKIEIDSQETYDNDIRIGEIILGPCVIPGRQYGRGRTITMESGTTTTETQDGMRYSREYKPPTRVFRVAWTDGVDISQLQGDEPDIDYWISSSSVGAEPIAVNNEAPDLMMEMVRYLQGAKKHFVYLPLITQDDDFRVLQRHNEHALVTLESDISIEHVVGDELQSGNIGEVYRIASINMKEVK